MEITMTRVAAWQPVVGRAALRTARRLPAWIGLVCVSLCAVPVLAQQLKLAIPAKVPQAAPAKAPAAAPPAGKPPAAVPSTDLAAEPDPFGEDPPRPAEIVIPALRLRLVDALPAVRMGPAVERGLADAFLAEIRELRGPLVKQDAGQVADLEVAVAGQILAVPAEPIVAMAIADPLEAIAGGDLANQPADAEAMQLQAFEQQFQGQFRGILKSELHFVRKVCQPDDQQFKPVVAKANDALKQATKKFAEVQRKMMRGGFRAGEDMSYPDPRKTIAEALQKAVRENLGEEQAEHYEREIVSRAEYRRKVAIQNLLFRLDNRLVLDDDQREKISEGLAGHFQESWSNQLEYMLYDHYQSNIPDDAVVPFLNDSQKTVWELSKSNVQSFWGLGGFGIQVADNVWDLPGVDLQVIDNGAAAVEVFAAPVNIASPSAKELDPQPAEDEPAKAAEPKQ